MKKKANFFIVAFLVVVSFITTQKLLSADALGASKGRGLFGEKKSPPLSEPIKFIDSDALKELSAYFSPDEERGYTYIQLRTDEKISRDLEHIIIPLRVSKEALTDKAIVNLVVRFGVEGRKGGAGVVRGLSVKAPGGNIVLDRTQIGLTGQELESVRIISVESSSKDQEGNSLNKKAGYKVYLNPNSVIRFSEKNGLKKSKSESVKPVKKAAKLSANALVLDSDENVNSSGPALSLTMRLNLQFTQHKGLIHVLMGHDYWVQGIAFSPDNKTLASVSADAVVNFWDTAKGNLKSFLGGTHYGAINSIVYSLDGKRFLTTSDDTTIKLWNSADSLFIKEFRGHSGAVTAFDLSPDGKFFATGSSDHTLRFWDIEKGAVYAKNENPDTWVTSIAYSKDGQKLAVGYWDANIRIWDTKSGKLLQTIAAHQKALSALVFSPDGKYLASGSYDCTVKLWDANKFEFQHVFMGSFESMFKTWSPKAGFLRHIVKSDKGHMETISALDFSPDSKVLASASNDKTINLMDVEKREIILRVNAHTKAVKSLKFSQNGKMLASGSMDRTVKIWDVNALLSEARKTKK